MKKITSWIKNLFIVNEKISIKILWFWIVLSFFLSIIFYSLVNFKILKMEISLTAFIALTGALPTVYLWIVKERKKEKDQEIALLNLEKKEKDQEIALSSLNKKDIELYQNKIAELNKVYVDAISQFYNPQSFMAGAYALNALIDDWLVLSREHQNDSEEHLIRVSQIASILFSKKTEVADDILFNTLIEKIFSKITRLTVDNKTFSFSWKGFTFKSLNLFRANLSSANLPGIDLVNADLTAAFLNKTNLIYADLISAILVNAQLIGADLTGANLIEATLMGARLMKANLTYADLSNAKSRWADVNEAIFSSTIISNNFILNVDNIRIVQLKGCLINNGSSDAALPISKNIIEQIKLEITDDDAVIPKEILRKYFK